MWAGESGETPGDNHQQTRYKEPRCIRVAGRRCEDGKGQLEHKEKLCCPKTSFMHVDAGFLTGALERNEGNHRASSGNTRNRATSLCKPPDKPRKPSTPKAGLGKGVVVQAF